VRHPHVEQHQVRMQPHCCGDSLLARASLPDAPKTRRCGDEFSRDTQEPRRVVDGQDVDWGDPDSHGSVRAREQGPSGTASCDGAVSGPDRHAQPASTNPARRTSPVQGDEASGGSVIDSKVVDALVEARTRSEDSPLAELTPSAERVYDVRGWPKKTAKGRPIGRRCGQTLTDAAGRAG